eukprot:scaffold55260_cov71-Attheya_sp.AAC.2
MAAVFSMLVLATAGKTATTAFIVVHPSIALRHSRMTRPVEATLLRNKMPLVSYASDPGENERLQTRCDQLEKTVADVEKTLAVQTRINQLDAKIGNNFNQLDAKIGNNFNQLDAKIGNNFNQLDAKIGQLDAKIGNIETLLENVLAWLIVMGVAEGMTAFKDFAPFFK